MCERVAFESLRWHLCAVSSMCAAPGSLEGVSWDATLVWVLRMCVRVCAFGLCAMPGGVRHGRAFVEPGSLGCWLRCKIG